MAMREALVVHDKVLRTAIEAYGGLVVQAHRRRGVRGIRVAEVSGRRRVTAQRELQLPVRMGIGDRRGGAARPTTSVRC